MERGCGFRNWCGFESRTSISSEARSRSAKERARKIACLRCRELHAALTSTRTAVEAHPAELKIKRTAFVKAADALRKRLRTTISELEIHLDRDSPHWGAFGLVAPAFKNRRRAKNLPATETVAATRESHSTTGTVAGTESVALTR
jgi:hypothetical protein